MPSMKYLEITDRAQFDALALETFRFQAVHCDVYAAYLHLLEVDPDRVDAVEDIPFLPIELFKSHTVYCGAQPPQHIFTSSATSGATPAHHFVADLGIYEESFTRCFRLFIGPPERYTILALLPSYLERQGASLVYMVDALMKQSGASENGFYLHNHTQLYHRLTTLRDRGVRTLLFGVSFALLDFLAHHTVDFPDLEVIETGGMKGRGREYTRTGLHQKISRGFGTGRVFSEYGMAELLSQAYAKGGDRFNTPPWMRVYIRDLHDPGHYLSCGQKGGINIIDLANKYSCSFIETQDLGIGHPDHSFEVLGRIPHSDLRGCNLLVG